PSRAYRRSLRSRGRRGHGNHLYRARSDRGDRASGEKILRPDFGGRGHGARSGNGAHCHPRGRAICDQPFAQPGYRAPLQSLSSALHARRCNGSRSGRGHGIRRGHCESLSRRTPGAGIRQGSESSTPPGIVDADRWRQPGKCCRLDPRRCGCRCGWGQPDGGSKDRRLRVNHEAGPGHHRKNKRGARPMSAANLWKSDDELFAIVLRELFTCVVGDVMDKLDLQHQFLPPQIQPLRQDMVVIGRAMPVLSVDVFAEKIPGSANKLMEKSFGLMLEALDDLRNNEVYVNTGSSPRNALWGELMSTRARKLGSRGAVLNGYVRDTKAILNMGFPTFGFGSYGQDSAPRYKVVDFRIPVEIGSVRVRPGDILFGDIDGVLLVP